MFFNSILPHINDAEVMNKEHVPVIIGAAQHTQRKEVSHPLDPLKLVALASENAITSTGNKSIKSHVDSLYMTTISSWIYADPPGDLGKALEIRPKNMVYMPITGSAPQKLINKAAISIARGNSKVALITGGDAYYSRYRRVKKNIKLDWPKVSLKVRNDARKAYISYLSDLEFKYNLNNATIMYALIETALNAASNSNFSKHLEKIGKRYERFSRIASQNPHAWSQNPYKAKEIITASPENRKICYPFTKRMVSNLYVDQSAAVIMTSEDFAEELSIDKSLWVNAMGGADLDNVFALSQRPRLYDSPAIREASKLALQKAGLTLGDIDAFDLYSCFPCMVEIARKEIGIPEDDERDLTITGGLSFFGGPFSSYSLHSIVTAVKKIQSNPSMKIMILANGGYNTSQSFGIYGKDRPAKSWLENDNDKLQEKIESEALPEALVEANGIITIEAYTFVYDRQGQFQRGLAIGRMENGRRAIAQIDPEEIHVRNVEEVDLVGKTCQIKFDAKLKLNKITLKE